MQADTRTMNGREWTKNTRMNIAPIAALPMDSLAQAHFDLRTTISFVMCPRATGPFVGDLR